MKGNSSSQHFYFYVNYNLLESIIEYGNMNNVIRLSLEYESTSGCESPSACVKMSWSTIGVGNYHIARCKFRIGRKCFDCAMENRRWNRVRGRFVRGWACWGPYQRTRSCSRGCGRWCCSSRVRKVKCCCESVVVVRGHLHPGTELEHQKGSGRHHILFLDSACRR